MAQLRYLDDAGHVQIRPLDSGNFLIGRAPTCQLALDDETISREHVRIDLEDGGRFRIRDLGSRNKTYVNGELITETLLGSGDVIRAGARILEFLDDSAKPDRLELTCLTPDRTEPPHSEWIKIKAPLSLTTGQIEQLSHLVSDQPVTARSEDLADIALGQVLLDLQAERGFIAMRGDQKTELRPLAHRALRMPPGGSLTPVSQTFVLAPLLQGVAGRYPQTPDQLSTKLGYASTGMVAPLLYRGECFGIIYVDRPTAKKPFAGASVLYLLAVGAYLGAVLGESTRKLVRSAARESAAWMTTIRRMQSLLSNTLESSDTFDIASKCFPGRARCGDFADVMHLDAQRMAAVIVDGGGHGAAGMAQAAALRAAVRAALTVNEDSLMDPTSLFGALNRMIACSKARQVLPVTYVGIDLTMGRLAYVNAGGMAPLLMVAPGRLVTLDQPALVLGVDPTYIHEAVCVDLPETFRVVCYTSGLLDAANGAGEALGDQRLHDALLAPELFASAADILAGLGLVCSNHLAGAPPDDDAMILVIGRGTPA